MAVWLPLTSLQGCCSCGSRPLPAAPCGVSGTLAYLGGRGEVALSAGTFRVERGAGDRFVATPRQDTVRTHSLTCTHPSLACLQFCCPDQSGSESLDSSCSATDSCVSRPLAPQYGLGRVLLELLLGPRAAMPGVTREIVSHCARPLTYVDPCPSERGRCRSRGHACMGCSHACCLLAPTSLCSPCWLLLCLSPLLMIRCLRTRRGRGAGSSSPGVSQRGGRTHGP